jgi:hypothetical protein
MPGLARSTGSTRTSSRLPWNRSANIGLQLIKYDAPDPWAGPVVETSIETFETGRRLGRLRSGLPGATRAVLPFSTPACEAYVSVRTPAVKGTLISKLTRNFDGANDGRKIMIRAHIVAIDHRGILKVVAGQADGAPQAQPPGSA